MPDGLQRLNGPKSMLPLFIVLAGVGVYLLSGEAHLDCVVVLHATSSVGDVVGFGTAIVPLLRH